MENFFSDRYQPIEFYQFHSLTMHAYESLTHVSADQVIVWRDAPSAAWLRPIKVITAEVAFIGIALLGIIESIARGILLLLIRPIHLFASDDSAIVEFYMSCHASLTVTTLATGIAISELVTNLLPTGSERAINRAVSDVWLFTYKLLFPIVYFRLCSDQNTTVDVTPEEIRAELENSIHGVNPDLTPAAFVEIVRKGRRGE